MISGLKMASKVFTIIYGAELGKPYALPNTCGRNFVRRDDGAEGRGYDKKRKSVSNRPANMLFIVVSPFSFAIIVLCFIDHNDNHHNVL